MPDLHHNTSARAKRSIASATAFGPLELRVMAGLGDPLEAGIGQCPAELLAVVWQNDAVLFAPDDQGRHAHPVQPAAQAGIVHVRAPAIECRRRPVAGDRGCLGVVELAVVRRMPRIEKGSAQQLVGRQRIDVADVALFAPAELDAQRVDQHEAADAFDRADAHFERDPAAERRADEHDVLQPLLLDQVEVEIGQVMDGTEIFGPLGPAEPGVTRGEHSPAPRQPVQERAVLRKIVAPVQEQQRPACSSNRDFERDLTDIDTLHSVPPTHDAGRRSLPGIIAIR